MFFLSSFKSFYLLISILDFSLPILIVSLFLTNLWFWKFCIRFIFNSILNYLFFSSLSVRNFQSLVTILQLLIHFFGIIFNQIILLPYLLSFLICLSSVNSFFIFSFDPFFSLVFMNFCIVLNSLHNNLFVKSLSSFCKRFIRIMFKLDSLPYAIHLKCINSIFKAFDLLIS